MLRLHRNKKNIFIFILLILFCVPSVLWLFHPGFFQSDDGEWMVIRFSAFHEALRDGQIPVRFLSRLNYGYGYPVANFLYPGFMYMGEFFKVLGFGFVESIKIILGLSIVGSAIFCYSWLSRFFDRLSSFIGSLFYLYTPYHLFDLYKRGSVGEVLSLAVMPFVLWQIERKSLFWASIGIAFLIISHNTLAVLFLGLILLYIALGLYVSKNKKEMFKKFLLMMMFGLGMSSFFWIPAFFELKHTVFLNIQVSEWNQYFTNPSLIGIPTFLVFVLTIIFFFAGKIKFAKHRLTALLLVIGILSIFFATSLSAPLWKILPASFIQFPFRFLSVSILSVAFLSSVIVNQLKSNQKIIATIVLFVLLGFSAVPYIKPTMFFDKGEGFYSTNEATTTVHNEYMPIWVKKKPVERYVEKVEIVKGVGEVNNLVYNSKKIVFDVDAKDNMKVRVNTIYYPGWKASVDNQDVTISYANEHGVMDIPIPSGKHSVKANFTETPLRTTSNTISLLSLFALLFLGIKSLHKSSSV